MMDLPPFFLLYSNKKSNAVGRGGALLRPLGSCKSAQCPVGADAHIGPLGSYEFAEDFHKTGVCRRVDVGIDPYKALHGQRLNVQTASDFAEIL